MATSSEVSTFMDRFTRAWKTRDPDDFADVFHPEGTVFHPTMISPVSGDELHAYFGRLRDSAPHVTLTVTNWASAGDTVLLEWVMDARYGGEELTWSGADRFTFRGDRAVEGVAYFDTMPLWGILDPSMRRGPLEAVVLAGPGSG